jgi:hypothetical protein
MTASIEEMESRYQVRYERAPWGLFPVTHAIDQPLGDSGRRAAWGCVTISNFEHVQWCLYTADGDRAVHGHETNYGMTRAGYRQMLRAALRHMRGGRRVYPRDPAVRKWPAGQNPWTRRTAP